MNDAVLTREERVVFALRDLYRRYGYRPYRMSKFEVRPLSPNAAISPPAIVMSVSAWIASLLALITILPPSITTSPFEDLIPSPFDTILKAVISLSRQARTLSKLRQTSLSQAAISLHSATRVSQLSAT